MTFDGLNFKVEKAETKSMEKRAAICIRSSSQKENCGRSNEKTPSRRKTIPVNENWKKSYRKTE